MGNNENTLFPELENDYVDKAVKRVELAYYQHQQITTDKMYLAFSRGKDSICLFYIALTAFSNIGVKMEDVCDVEYNLTSVDPPELVYFIREFKGKYPFVKINYPKLNMFQLIEKTHILPTASRRFCCAELKESKGNKGFTLTGVRWAESVRRKSRGAFEDGKNKIIKTNDNDEMRKSVEFCIMNKRYYCNPIIDWSDSDVWNYIKRNNLPYCKLYDEGFSRIGCIGCPLKSKKQRKSEFEKYPKYKNLYLRSIERICEWHKAKGRITLITVDEMFDWWMGDRTPDNDYTNTLFPELEDSDDD